ncbi:MULTISPECIES: CoA pyrophosphatase [Sphingobium]|uniref:CoA pyrophosphatase n=1 Tax=Sphingobium TaxID=165695 RepID=UPI0015EC811C|nr:MULTISPECIES: CoA pyrophosphatase [Sphingobium]MCW2363652.1 8-oxo-dGTP pyrophosphatase MutT (NUDIX family) [Sphingobium sp. B10D3B]MCW2402950.1 8-oxo-dGTP pyrophosphatase MutT (NUDIX family) [Sphingobium sp. B10D7B]MCW2409928.1 8-oxo-dGTP pyrophosphatase MutT (NUDIX family) [Sphingobium xanthum]
MSWRDRLTASLRPEFDSAHTHDFFLYRNRPEPAGPFTPAAVLIAVTDRPDPGMIFTLRHAGLRAHAGQVAFPGGRLDPGDRDAVEAALREAHEEIALPPEAVEVMGRSDRFRTGTGFEIEPIVGIVPPDLALRPSEAEVDAIFEVPLDFLLDPTNRALRTVDWEGGTRSYYEFLWQEHRIWGVTAAMLVNLARRIEAAA